MAAAGLRKQRPWDTLIQAGGTSGEVLKTKLRVQTSWLGTGLCVWEPLMWYRFGGQETASFGQSFFLHPISVEETQYLLFSLPAFLPLLPTVCLYKYRLGLCFLSQLSPFSLELHVVKAGRSEWPDGDGSGGC